MTYRYVRVIAEYDSEMGEWIELDHDDDLEPVTWFSCPRCHHCCIEAWLKCPKCQVKFEYRMNVGLALEK